MTKSDECIICGAPLEYLEQPEDEGKSGNIGYLRSIITTMDSYPFSDEKTQLEAKDS